MSHCSRYLAVGSILTTLASTASAAPVDVTNFSFENPSTGFNSNLGDFGWAEPDGGAFVETIGGFAADGTQHVAGSNYRVHVDLTTDFAPDTTYTLTVAVGNRVGQSSPGNQSVYEIRDTDDNVWATATYDAFANVAGGTFADAPSLIYTTPTVGGPTGAIRIALADTGPGRSHFDNVRLDAAASTVIPEPASLALLGVGGVCLLGRRRRAA